MAFRGRAARPFSGGGPAKFQGCTRAAARLLPEFPVHLDGVAPRRGGRPLEDGGELPHRRWHRPEPAGIHRGERRQHPGTHHRAFRQCRHDVAVQGIRWRRLSTPVLCALLWRDERGKGGRALSRLLSCLLDAEAGGSAGLRPAVSISGHALRARGGDVVKGHGAGCVSAQPADQSTPCARS